MQVDSLGGWGALRGGSSLVVTQGVGTLRTDFLDPGRASSKSSSLLSWRGLSEAARLQRGQWGSNRARDTAPIYHSPEILWFVFYYCCRWCFLG